MKNNTLEIFTNTQKELVAKIQKILSGQYTQFPLNFICLADNKLIELDKYKIKDGF
jgi:hypothetical protein